FGGIADRPTAGQPWWGYVSAGNPETLRAKYEELVGAVLDCPTIAGFCYTQLTDTEQERNGLLTADRTPKLAPDTVRAITGRPSRAMPGEVIGALQTQAEATAAQRDR